MSTPRADSDDPILGLSRRRLALLALVALAAVSAAVVLAPQVKVLSDAAARIGDADARWLLAAVALETLAVVSYGALFRAVVGDAGSGRIGWGASFQITLAASAATKVLAAGGAGGIAVTAWALRRSGMDARTVARRMTAFIVLLYGVYAAAVVVGGIGLRAGLLAGPAPLGLTLVPAAVGALVILAALGFARFGVGSSGAGERAEGGGLRARLRAVPGVLAWGVRDAIGMLATARAGLLGALGWWVFDIAVLGAALAAFAGTGETPAVAVLVMAYFVGLVGNLLPLPGGFGGVEGGMVGSFVVFGVDADLAVVAVLTYRVISFWLPALPGAGAYVLLRRTVARWSDDDGAPAGGRPGLVTSEA